MESLIHLSSLRMTNHFERVGIAIGQNILFVTFIHEGCPPYYTGLGGTLYHLVLGWLFTVCLEVGVYYVLYVVSAGLLVEINIGQLEVDRFGGVVGGFGVPGGT